MRGNVIIVSTGEGEYSLAIVTAAWMNLDDGGTRLIFRLCTKMFVGLLICVLVSPFSRCQTPDASKLSVRWDKVVRVSKTTPTLQVVVNPPLRRGTPVHDNAFRALHQLQADYVRYGFPTQSWGSRSSSLLLMAKLPGIFRSLIR